jgi:hypothetical protein
LHHSYRRARRRYFALAALAGGSCIILSLVGLSGRLIGILSGLLEPPEPEAASGGFTIDAPPFCGAACVFCAGLDACPNAKVTLVLNAASAPHAFSAAILLRSISSSFPMPLAGFAADTLVG